MFKQKAASFVGEYSSHEGNNLNQEDWNLGRSPSNPDHSYFIHVNYPRKKVIDIWFYQILWSSKQTFIQKQK